MKNNTGWISVYRKLLDSDIMRMPPVTRELWIYILLKVQHEPYKNLKRGQMYMRLSDVQEDLHWYIGYRKMKYSKPQLTKSLRRLREGNAIETMKATHGIVVSVCNYDIYQDRELHEGNDEGNAKEMRRKRRGHNINNNVNNVNNENNFFKSEKKKIFQKKNNLFDALDDDDFEVDDVESELKSEPENIVEENPRVIEKSKAIKKSLENLGSFRTIKTQLDKKNDYSDYRDYTQDDIEAEAKRLASENLKDGWDDETLIKYYRKQVENKCLIAKNRDG